ncbi:DUF488 domain-containing protein [Alkaliphilus crotonatoxidans]
MPFKIKRIYEAASLEDGKRVLVDRLWPRGVSKDQAMLDLWLKDIAPSPELRKAYNHKPERHEEFRKMYEHELSTSPVCKEAVKLLKPMGLNETVTLLYGARDPVYNHAIVLLNWLKNN